MHTEKYVCDQEIESFNPEKENTCQEGLRVVNWEQIQNQSPAIIAEGSHIREKPQTELPSLLHYVPAVWADPYRKAPGVVFQPMGLRLSLSNQSWASVFLFASLPTYQSSSIMTNQNMRFWLISTVQYTNLKSSFE